MAYQHLDPLRFDVYVTFAIGLAAAILSIVGDIKAHPFKFGNQAVKSVERTLIGRPATVTDWSSVFQSHGNNDQIKYDPAKDLGKEHRDVAKVLLKNLQQQLSTIHKEFDSLRKEEKQMAAEYEALKDLMENDSSELKDILMVSTTLRRLGIKGTTLEDKRLRLLDNHQATLHEISLVNQQLKGFEEKHDSKNHKKSRVIHKEANVTVAAGNGSSPPNASPPDAEEEESEADHWAHNIPLAACTCALLLLPMALIIHLFIRIPILERPAGVATILVILMLCLLVVARYYILLFADKTFFLMVFVIFVVVFVLSIRISRQDNEVHAEG